MFLQWNEYNKHSLKKLNIWKWKTKISIEWRNCHHYHHCVRKIISPILYNDIKMNQEYYSNKNFIQLICYQDSMITNISNIGFFKIDIIQKTNLHETQWANCSINSQRKLNETKSKERSHWYLRVYDWECVIIDQNNNVIVADNNGKMKNYIIIIGIHHHHSTTMMMMVSIKDWLYTDTHTCIILMTLLSSNNKRNTKNLMIIIINKTKKDKKKICQSMSFIWNRW